VSAVNNNGKVFKIFSRACGKPYYVRFQFCNKMRIFSYCGKFAVCLERNFILIKSPQSPKKCTVKILCIEKRSFNFFDKETSKAGGAEQNSGKKFTAPASLPKWSAEPPKIWAKNFYFAPASSPDVIATIPNAIGLVFTFLNPASENIFSTSARLG